MDTNHSMRAAEGWIDLGNFNEAAEELHNCPPALKSSVPWVKLWVRIYTAKKAWSNVQLMCETLLAHDPDDSFGLMSYAEALHQQGRTREAFAVFQRAPVNFKQGHEYFYALACYLCALGQKAMALGCLGKVFDLKSEWKLKALDDPELESVWTSVQEI